MTEDCIFCKIIAGDLPAYKVYEDEHTLALLDINPRSPYHSLVIPKKHSKDFYEIMPDELQAVMKTIQKVAKLYREKLGYYDMQVLNNCGVYGQQSVWHTHFHLVPRFKGDGLNWMPVSRPDLIENLPALLAKLKE